MFSEWAGPAGGPVFSQSTTSHAWDSFWQDKLLVRHGEAPQVPEYPEDQADENKQRSRQHKEVPESEWCKEPQEEEDEADNITNQSQNQEENAAAILCIVPNIIHCQAKGWKGWCCLNIWSKLEESSPGKGFSKLWNILLHF